MTERDDTPSLTAEEIAAFRRSKTLLVLLSLRRTTVELTLQGGVELEAANELADIIDAMPALLAAAERAEQAEAERDSLQAALDAPNPDDVHEAIADLQRPWRARDRIDRSVTGTIELAYWRGFAAGRTALDAARREP